jgi:Cd(II)/Pb(II)-responsive transcriptional regulator
VEIRIGQLAKLTGYQVETIRFYEQKGILPAPVRSESNYRMYGKTHVERLQFVRRCRSLGMSLEEVRTLLTFHDQPGQPCDGVNDVLDQHIADIDRQMAELRALHTELMRLRASCGSARPAGECQILKELVNAPADSL